MKLELVFVILILFFLFVSSVFAFHGIGRSVKMKFVFHISGSDEKNQSDFFLYARNSSSNISLSLICVGESFGSQISSLGNDNLFEMKQALDGNRFILGFTNSTFNDVSKKIKEARENKILGKTLGSLSYSIPDVYLMSLRLEYDNIDILNDTRWIGSSNILIKNEDSGKIPKITIQVVG